MAFDLDSYMSKYASNKKETTQTTTSTSKKSGSGFDLDSYMTKYANASSYVDAKYDSVSKFGLSVNSLLKKYNNISSTWRENDDPAYDSYEKQRQALLASVNSFKATYKDDAEISRYLNSLSKSLGSASLDSLKKYNSQFSSQDEYNAYKRNSELTSKYSGKSYSDIQKAMSGMNQGSDEYEWLSQNQYSYMSTDELQAEIDRVTKEKRAYISKNATAGYYTDNDYLKVMNGYDSSIEKLKKLKSQKENDAKYGKLNKQEGYKENSYVDESIGKGLSFIWNDKSFGPGDGVYAFINNMNGVKDEALASDDVEGAGGLIKYAYMTDNEISNYNYLYNVEGKKSANEYLDYIEETLNIRAGVTRANEVLSIPNKVGREAAVIGSSIGVGLDQYISGVKQFFSSKEQNATQMQAYNSVISQNLKGAEKYVYEAGSTIGNMLPSIVLNYVTGGLGSLASGASMFVSAGGNAKNEALADGYTLEQSRTYGVLVGLSEAALEKLLGGISGLRSGSALSEKLIAKASMIDNALLRIAAKGAISIGSELTEEETQNFLEPLFRTIIFGEDYDAPTVEELLETAIVTALSTGVLEGTNAGINSRIESSYFKEVYGSQIQDLVNESVELNPDNELAKKIQTKLDSKKKVSGKDIRSIVQQNESTMRSQDMDTITSSAKEQLTKYGETGDVDSIAKAIAKQASGEKLTKAEQKAISESKYGQRVANELNPENIRSGEYNTEWAEKLDTNRINTDEYSRLVQEAQIEPDSNSTDTTAVDTDPKETATVANPVASQSTVEAPSTVVQTTTDNNVPAKVMSIEEYSKNYGEQAGAFVHTYEQGQDVAKYESAYSKAYEYAQSGVPMSTVVGLKSVSYLNETQRELAYKAGEAASTKTAQLIDARKNKNTSVANKTRKKGTVRAMDGIKVSDLNARQSNAYRVLSRIAEATGINIVLINSTATDANGKLTGYEGKYSHSEDTIYIDINSGIEYMSDIGDERHLSEYTMLRTFSHEFTHWLEVHNATGYNDLRKLVFQRIEDNIKNRSGNAETIASVDELIKSKLDLYRSKVDKNFTYEQASREVMADAMTDILPDSNFIEQLYKENQDLFHKMWRKLTQFLENLKEYFDNITANTKNEVAQLKQEIDGQIRYAQDIVDMFDKVAKQAVENYQNEVDTVLADNGIIVDNSTDSASIDAYSVRYLLDEKAKKKVNEALQKKFGVTKEEANNWLTAETSIASLVLNPKYSQYLDYEADPNEEAIKKNSDYPQGTVDFSPICKKRRDFTNVMNAVFRSFTNHVFAATDLAKIRTIMGEEGMTLACGICYVEDRRQLDSIVAQNFIDSLKLYREGSKTRPDGKPFNAGQLEGLRKTDGDDYVPSIYELVSLEGRNKLREKNPNMEAAWVRFNSARGMQSVRLLSNEAEYKRQILKYNKNTVKSKNNNGGLRIYSFSDAEMFHLIDIIQIITDSSVVGLSIQGYTKVNEYAQAVKDTGEKLNRSLIPKGKLGYHMEDGKVVLDFDPVEGIDINSPYFFDATDNPNIGNIVIGINATQIRAAMVSPFIDQIIPFHTSQSEEVLKEKEIDGWGNYRDYQTEKDIATGTASEHHVNIYTEVLQVLEAEGKPINKRTFVEKFLAVCKENGLTPRFSQFLNTDENGDYVYTEGYHKMLVDFKTFAQTEVGEYLPQLPVKPVFDDAFLSKILKEYVEEQKAHDEMVAKSMPRVIERITNEIIKPEQEQDQYLVRVTDEDTLKKLEKAESEGIREWNDISEDDTKGVVKVYRAMQAQPVDVNGNVIPNASVQRVVSYDPLMVEAKVFTVVGRKKQSETIVANAKLFSPMAGAYNGVWRNPISLNEWEMSEGHLERATTVIDDKTGNPKIDTDKKNASYGEVAYYYGLEKGGVDDNGNPLTDVPARYNPYVHTSLSALNDQFSSGNNRPELVTVETLVPVFHIKSGERLPGAKDRVGAMSWHSGPTSSRLAHAGNPRVVILSRYDKPIRVVPDSEVAESINKFIGSTTDIAINGATVTPSLASELQKAGIDVLYGDDWKEYASSHPQEYFDTQNPDYVPKKRRNKNSDQYSVREQPANGKAIKRVLSGTFFSGGGTVDFALSAILDHQFAVEYDAKISAVYQQNNDTMFIGKDVQDFDPTQWVGKIDYFHASPVCKTYSKAISKEGKAKRIDTGLDISTAKATAYSLETIQPKAFTLENVPAYLGSDALKLITDVLDKLGYTWDIAKYNSADYGAATSRERVFLRAVKEGELPKKPQRVSKRTSWYDVTEDLIPTLTEKESAPNWLLERLKSIGIDVNNIDKPLYVSTDAPGATGVPHAFSDKPAPTITANEHMPMLFMPDGRMLEVSPRMLARISGLPDDYKLPKAKGLGKKIIGNGVPVKLTQAVVGSLLNDVTGQDVQYAIRDSEGNKLSEGQQEFFKDSKIRDEDGNLLVVYHGGTKNYTVFDRTKGRSTADIQGTFFSPWEIDASGYGENVRVFYLNIKNPAPEGIAYKALNMFKGQNNAGVKAREYLEKLGYDGVNNSGEEYIAFDPNQIKLISNKNPTESDDIRYQLRESNLSDREVLRYASQNVWNDNVKTGTLSEEERTALWIFQRRLNKLDKYEQQRLDLLEQRRSVLNGREKSELTAEEKTELRKIQNNLDTTNGQIKRTNEELLKIEQQKVLQKLLKQARRVVEKDTRQRGLEELQAYKNKRNDTEASRKYRQRVVDHAMQLSDWLEKNSDKEHIPEVLKKPLAELLTSIDFSSKRFLRGGELTKADKKFGANLAALNQLIAGQQGAIEGDDNAIDNIGAYLDISVENRQFLNDLVNAMASVEGTFTINRMTSEQLKSFSQFLANLSKAIRMMNKTLANARYQNIPTMAQNSMAHFEAMGNAKTAEGTPIARFLQWTNTTPYYAFKRFGEAGESLFDGFTKGWEKLAFNAQEIINFTNKTYSSEEANAWRNQIHNITLEDGKKIQMTTAQIMELSQLLNREQARKHIQAGGIRIGNIKAKIGAKQDVTHYHFTIEDCNKVVSLLTDRQKNVAESLRKYMGNRGGEWGNEISMARFGYRFYTEGEDYYTIRTDSNGRPMKDTDEQTNSMFRLLNLSSSKSLNPKANNALIVNDIFDTFSDHMADMAKLNALGLPLLDAIKWFNYTEKTTNDDGTIDQEGIKKSMEKAFGTSAGSYFRTLLKDINGVKESGDRGGNLASKMMSNYKVAAVASNLRVALLQPTSYVRAMYVLNPKNMVNAFFSKNAYKEAMKYSGTAVWKSLGYYDTDISKSMRSQIEHDETWKDKLKDKSMILAEKGDQRTWGRLWVACKLQAKQNNPSLNGEDLNKATAEIFRKVIYATQVMDSTLTRSEMMRGSTRWTKIATAFMAEPTLSMNILMDSASQFAIDQRKTNTQEAWRKNKHKIALSLITYVSSAAAAALIESIADAFRDDDDYETLLQKISQAFFGEGGFMSGNFGQDLTLVGKIPVLKNILSTLKGDKSSDMSIASVEAISNAFNIWKETIQLANGTLENPTSVTWNGKMTPWGKIYKSLQALSQLSGFAVSNLTRDVVAIYNGILTIVSPDSKHIKTYDSGAKNNIKYAYQDGYLSEEEAINKLIEEGEAKDKNDAYWIVNNWETGESAYGQLYDALLNGGNVSEAVKNMTDHGYKKADVVSKIKSKVGEWFRGTEDNPASISESQAISMLTKYCGLTSDDARETVTAWKAKRDTGMYVADIGQALRDGEITQSKAESMWVQYGGLTAEEAHVKAQKITYAKKYPDWGGLGSALEDYQEYGSSYFSEDEFVDHVYQMDQCDGWDNNGDGKADRNSKRQEIWEYIDSLPLSRDAKDALHLAAGYKATTLQIAPWYKHN